LLKVVRDSPTGAIRQEALGALQRYPDPKIARAVLALYPARLPEADGVRSAAHALLASRPAWAQAFLQAIHSGQANPRGSPADAVQKLAVHKDRAVAALVARHFGRVRGNTPAQKQREMLRLGKVLQAGKGDPKAGKVVYAATCGKCHKLFGEGGDV